MADLHLLARLRNARLRRALLLASALFAALSSGAVATERAANRGRALITEKGCGACHEIPGVDGAEGLVGPPLGNIARRVYLGGYLRNSPSGLAAWVLDRQRFAPGSAMPATGLSPQEAQDVAAYLGALR